MASNRGLSHRYFASSERIMSKDQWILFSKVDLTIQLQYTVFYVTLASMCKFLLSSGTPKPNPMLKSQVNWIPYMACSTSKSKLANFWKIVGNYMAPIQ